MSDAELKRGDKVKLKSRKPEGVIKTMDEDSRWVCVEWTISGPMYVDMLELEVCDFRPN